MRWLLPIALLGWLCHGCFVLDEIDKGHAIMDKHSPRKREEPAQPAAPRTSRSAGEEPGIVQGALAWWKQVREPAPVRRDPDDVAVGCEVEGKMQFMRKSDCALRGGRIL
jgi:hypothetical protein